MDKKTDAITHEPATADAKKLAGDLNRHQENMPPPVATVTRGNAPPSVAIEKKPKSP